VGNSRGFDVKSASLSLEKMKFLLPLALGVVWIGGLVFAGIKVQHIQGLRWEIGRVERELSTGQQVWRRYPPLHAAERRALEENQERLLRRLPEDRDIPRLLEDVSRLTQEHHFSDVALNTENRDAPGAPSAVAAVTNPTKVSTAAPPGPVASFPMKLSFAGDYREIPYFLGEVENLPRIVKVESVTLRRGVPLVQFDVSWKVYYRSGDLEAWGK
jgi:Tfp pilus assembly protein PilO